MGIAPDHVEQAEIKKVEANECFKAANYDRAIELCTSAIELNPQVATYYGNRSFAYLKHELYGFALYDACKAIQLDNTYVKAYYRRATANMALGNVIKALEDFEMVYKARPRDPDAKKKYEECNDIVKHLPLDPIDIASMDISDRLEPFPRAFPPPVLDLLFSYLPWRNRIPLERTSRLCLGLLRPQGRISSLPIDPNVSIHIVQQLPNEKVDEGREIHIENKIDGTQEISIKFNGNLIENLDRIFAQVPSAVLRVVCIESLDLNFFNFVSQLSNRIVKFEIMYSVIKGNRFSREIWKGIWDKFPKLTNLALSYKTDIDCSIDDILIDLVQKDQLEELTVELSPNDQNLGMSDALLVALSQNCSKLTKLNISEAPNVTIEGVSSLIQALANMQSPLPEDDQPYEGICPYNSQRAINLSFCNLANVGVLEQRFPALDKIFFNSDLDRFEAREVNQFPMDFRGFANKHFFVKFIGGF